MEVKTHTLDELKKGQEAVIVSVDNEDKALRNHILNMGLTPGVTVSLIKTAPMGDPMEFRLRGYELTLRKENAAKIIIKDISETKHFVYERNNFQESEHSQIGEERQYIENNKIPAKIKVKFALAGNQNSGKTTLFNMLTGSNQKVGNFPGVTVDRVDGIIKGDNDVTITDLPGIYS